MMTGSLRSLVHRLARDERGAILPVVTAALPVIFGTTALAIDYGYVQYVQNQLQAATDAAALAGAQGLSDGTYTAKADLYSSSASVGGINTIAGISVPAPTINTRCSTTMEGVSVACHPYNVIQVTQTAQVPLFFGKAIGLKPKTAVTIATAAAAGGKFPALNVMVILPTTASMNNNDPCVISISGLTKLACAEMALQQILTELNPSIDYIGLEVFPGMLSSVTSYDTGCGGVPGSTGELIASPPAPPPGTTVNIAEYGAAGFTGSPGTDTYTVVGLSTCTLGSGGNCYRTSNSSTSLNSSSPLVQAAGDTATSTTGCLQVPQGTTSAFFADAITQAQTQLTTFQTSLGSPGANSQNVIIILSDGNANASNSTTPPQIVASEAQQQCNQAITAAANASAAGTWVYSIAYGASTSGGCPTDTNPSITAYCTMLEIASGPKFFYSDTSPSGACPNGVTGPAASTNILTIFQNIGASLSSVRLIPAAAYSN